MPTDRPQATRVTAMDAVRGLVMVIMALDHVRDFIHRAAQTGSPTDLSITTPELFFTRWITHLCAPLFMLTAGMGAFLWWRQGRSTGQLSTYLLTRGLWLVLLELTVMRLAYNFNFLPQYPVFLLVLWVLGACMIVLAALVWLPVRVLLPLSIAVIALHNLLDPILPDRFGAAAGLWNLLHRPGAFRVGEMFVIVGYPLVPWFAVMALGFCLGRIWLMEPAPRRRILLASGTAMSLAFVVLRAINGYGDNSAWSTQPSPVFTVLSFLNTSKYPPSLDFLLMTLGPGMLLLAWAERLALKPSHPLVVIGRVPLFWFVVHFYAAHLAVALLAVLRYGGDAWRFILHPVPAMGAPDGLYPEPFGYSLGVTYLVWIVVCVALYPAVRWFANLKARRRDWWLSYL